MKLMCVVALAGAALLAGCSAEPVLLNGSDQGVVVRYSQSHATAADAAAVATKYCAQYGRQAVQGDGNSMTGDTFLSFTCEKP